MLHPGTEHLLGIFGGKILLKNTSGITEIISFMATEVVSKFCQVFYGMSK